MARHSDPELEKRILNTARKLWHRGGESALTMRTVAEAAGSNTPAVYRRFRSRNQLLLALVEQYQSELFHTLEPCRSLQQFALSYFDFALSRPREYELMMSGMLARLRRAKPNFELLLKRCAEWMGGSPDQYRELALALSQLAHGAVMDALADPVTRHDPATRRVFVRAVSVLAANAKTLRTVRRRAEL